MPLHGNAPSRMGIGMGATPLPPQRRHIAAQFALEIIQPCCTIPGVGLRPSWEAVAVETPGGNAHFASLIATPVNGIMAIAGGGLVQESPPPRLFAQVPEFANAEG
jgi:hypothetical protein